MSYRIEDRIRISAHYLVRVRITAKVRNASGFTITMPDGTKEEKQSKRTALQSLLAKVRCQQVRTFTLTANPKQPKKGK